MCTLRHDSETGAYFVVALHSTTRGPAAGGTRAMEYQSLDEAVHDATRLAEVMTMKMSAAQLPMGGGKSVIALPAPRHEIDSSTWNRLLALHGQNLALLRGSYWTGPDIGTRADDMDTLYGLSGFAFGRTTTAGGPGSSAPTTAHGVHTALTASAQHAGMHDLRGVRIDVQGLGAVGMELATMLINDGAIVTACDIDSNRCEQARSLGAHIVATEEILLHESDIYAPCAVGGTIDDDVAATISTRVIAGAANNVLTSSSAADVLAQRGIVFAPDFIANSGGAIHLVGHEVLKWSTADVMRHVANIADTLDEVFQKAEDTKTSCETAARQLARRRLETGDQ